MKSSRCIRPYLPLFNARTAFAEDLHFATRKKKFVPYYMRIDLIRCSVYRCIYPRDDNYFRQETIFGMGTPETIRPRLFRQAKATLLVYLFIRPLFFFFASLFSRQLVFFLSFAKNKSYLSRLCVGILYARSMNISRRSALL